MTSNLPSRLRDALGGRDIQLYGQRVPARLKRETGDAILREQARTLIDEAHVLRVKRVVGSGLRAVEELTDQEALALARNPLGEARYKAIVDTATAGIAHIVAQVAED